MKKSVRLPSHVKPERYQIMLKPDLEEFIFSGEEIIHIILDKPVKQITLHSLDLEIECAKAEKVSYDKKSETVTLTFPKMLPKGKEELKLTFKGILNDKMRGFYRSKYGENKYLATTQFESTDARRAFPCFDEPAHKAVFDVSLQIPKNTTAISNTIESNISEHESGYKIIEFAPTPKMSTYLLAFIVGEFEYVQDGRIRVFTTPGKKKQAKFALDVAIKCLNFYENYFGIKYPLPVLDMIAIPDFAAGAMENWGAVTYRESTLLIDEESSSTANKQWVALVIAHELAHMWFGDLVTMEWWTHLWLNEGFASFIEYLAIDHIFPGWDIWTQFVGTELADALALDALENTHPIEVEVGHPAEISEIFDKVSYAKGASIIRMLWKYLGDEDFKEGLRHYLKKHSFSNTKTEDLWNTLEEVSGKPVGKIMKNWTSKPGHPVISAKFKVQSSKLELTQSRFFSSPISKKESNDKTIWSIPIDQFLMDKKTMTVPDTGNKLNIGEVSLVRINYPKDYSFGKLGATDRLGLIRDAFDLAQSGESSTSRALEIALDYVGEEDYTVWSQLTGNLAQLNSLLAHNEDFQKYGRKIYKKIACKMGWNKKPNEKHTDGLLRNMVLNMLGSFGDKGTIKTAQSLFGKKMESDLKSVVYNLTAENGGKAEFDTLIKMYRDEDNQQEKERIGRSLGQFSAKGGPASGWKSKQLLSKTLEFAISTEVRFQNSLGIIASVWHNPDGRYLAWEFVKNNWKLLKERYAGGHYFTRIFTPAGDFTKVSDAKDIEKFIKANPVPEAKRTIAQVLEQIYSNAEWLKRDSKKIKNFLGQFTPENY